MCHQSEKEGDNQATGGKSVREGVNTCNDGNVDDVVFGQRNEVDDDDDDVEDVIDDHDVMLGDHDNDVTSEEDDDVVDEGEFSNDDDDSKTGKNEECEDERIDGRKENMTKTKDKRNLNAYLE